MTKGSSSYQSRYIEAVQALEPTSQKACMPKVKLTI